MDMPPVMEGLNIKNEKAHRLARELSTEAIRGRLDRMRDERSVGVADRLLAIGKDCAASLKEPFCTAKHGDLLHDERGLPR
jgi:hypothetical protein